MLAKIFKHAAHFEDNLVAITIAWIIGLLVAPLAGFYLGTIFGSDHVIDLQTKDMMNGFVGAGIGLAIGVVGALIMTIVYPKVTLRDGDVAMAHGNHESHSEAH